MGLQSLQYCAFLVVVAAVYLHLPGRMQPVFLLGASWVFYALAMPAMLPVTIALAVFTYLCGRGLAWRGGAHKTAFLRLGVIGMLGILAFFKYNGLLGGVLHGWRAVAMPLGISFTSFAAIAYLIDATRGDCEVETSFIRLALFLNFFATVTQGPICRAGALLPQLSAEHRFDAARTVRALRLYALGLFKYIAVADVLNMVVDTVFPHYADYSAPMLILTAVMYTSAFPAIPRFPVPPALCWGWTCRKTLRPRFTPPTFPASGAAGTSRFLPGCRIISLCRWPGQILAALAACPPSCACSACSLLPASGTAAPRHSSSGVCCRRFTAWAKSCCTAALANPKSAAPRPVCCGASGLWCLFCGPSAWCSSAWACPVRA